MPKPVVLFVTPDKYTLRYTELMKNLSAYAMSETGKDPDDVELAGFVSQTPEYASATLHFLNRSGVEVANVIAMVLFGEAGNQLSFNSSALDECLLCSVVIQESAVSVPTLCVPSFDTGWATDEANWEDIKTRYTALMREGRKLLTGGEPYTFVTRGKVNWN